MTASLSVAALISAGVVAGAGVASASPAADTAARTPLAQSLSPAVARSKAQSDVPGTQKLSAAVSLKLRNRAELDTLIANVSTPGSALYGDYLTPAQFNARYAPTQAQVDQVRSYLTGQGLKVTGVSANRQVVDVTGSTSKMEKAFATSEVNYLDTAEQRHFYANSKAPSLPTGIASLVQGITGLDNHTTRHANLAAEQVAPNATPSGFGPTQIDGAYRFNQMSADGTGQTVAFVEFDGYKASDLTTYNTQYSLSGPAASTVSVDGANYDSSPGDGQVEVELDAEVVRAVAPKATQLIYEAPNSDQGQLDMFNKIVSDNRAQVISNSWGSCEPDTTPSVMTSGDNAMAQAAAQGISMYSASGDDGSHDCARSTSGSGVTAVDFPASSPNGTGVGGTTLTVSGTTYSSEHAWSGSGGGTSTVFAHPSWQAGSAKRMVPDVSSNADPNSGFAVYSQGSWGVVGGTSAAAPTWAGFTALVNQKAAAAGHAKVGLANPALYQIGAGSNRAASFHDVTSGSNGNFSAGTGYDQVTGLGTPVGDGLANALLGTGGSTGGNTVTVTNPGSKSTQVNTAASLQISASDSASGQTLTYSATGLPTGLSINSSTGLISGTPTVAGTYSVNVSVHDTTGATGSAAFTWTVTSGSGGCTASQLLGNPGFETGSAAPWTASTGVIDGSTDAPAHSGSYKAWLDGYGTTHTDTLSQSITVPSTCTSATLTFWLYVSTDETTTTTAYDKLTVAAGTTTLATYSNLNASSGYVQKTVSLSSQIGKTFTLKFTGTEDSSLATSFVIDDTAANVS